MKKLFVIIVVFFSMLGCKKVLDLQPLDSATTNSFFKSSADFDLAVNGLYNYMQQKSFNGLGGVFAGGIWFDVASDGMYYNQSWQNPWYNFSDATVAPYTGNVNFLWDVSYQAINWANTILANLKEADLNEAYKKNMDSEVRFLRAITYLRLVSTYGACPIVTKSISVAESKIPKNSIDEVFTQIYSDLDVAAKELKVIPYNSQKGRITKQAAMGMKVRTLIYQASPLFNPDNDLARWNAAKTAANQLIELANQNKTLIDILPNYQDIFDNTNKNNKEILFNIEYTGNHSVEGQSNQLPFGVYLSTNNSIGKSAWGQSALAPELLDSYLMSDGLKASESPLYSSSTPWKNRDPRFYATYYVAGISVLVNGDIFQAKWLNSYAGADFLRDYPIALKKGLDASSKATTQFDDENTNDIVLRYADILLMYAEAQNEFSGPDESVHIAINKIRNRVGLPNLSPNLSQSEMRTAIQNERKWELAFESVRYFDIRRWKIADVVMNSLKKMTSYGVLPAKRFDPLKNYWWPIAQSTIDANPKIKQNEGY